MHPVTKLAEESWRNFNSHAQRKSPQQKHYDRGVRHAEIGVPAKSKNIHYLRGYARQYEKLEIESARTVEF